MASELRQPSRTESRQGGSQGNPARILGQSDATQRRQDPSAIVPQHSGSRKQAKSKGTKASWPTSLSTDFRFRSSISKDIVVAGGGSQSYEVFNWYTQKWTLHKDTLFFDHDDAFSFSYGEKIAICGGTDTNRVEYLNITNNRFASTCRVQLPGTDCGKGVLCGDKILTFGQTSVLATSLKSPFKTTVLFAYKEGRKLSSHGVARVNENAIAIVGGYNFKSKNQTSDRVFMFNPITKRLTRLAPLPYGIAEAAVLVYKDNLVILGGTRSYHLDSPTGARFLKTESLNDVLMYNITKQQCHKMPHMMEKRSRCAAVIMGNTIVVMGGISDGLQSMTAEYLILGREDMRWRKLAPMHCKRAGAAACFRP